MFYKSMRRGDVGAMEYVLQLWGPQFVGARKSNYGDTCMDIRAGMLCEWDEQLKRIVHTNWVITPWGRSGKFPGLDEFREEIVRNLKELQNPENTNVLDTFARDVSARNVIYLMRVKEDLRKSMGVRKRSGNHVKRDRSGDVLA